MTTASTGVPLALGFLLVMLGNAWAQPAPASPQLIRYIELTEGPTPTSEEIRIRPGLATTLLFDSRISGEQVELEARERFDRVAVDEGTLVLVPSHQLQEGDRLQLTVRFAEETPPKTVRLLLRVDTALADVQVEFHRPAPSVESIRKELEQARAEVQRLRDEHSRLRAEPASSGLSGLIAAGMLDERGASALGLDTSDIASSDSTVQLNRAATFRTSNRVVVSLSLELADASRPWRVDGAVLLGGNNQRPRVLNVSQWQSDTDKHNTRVVVEAVTFPTKAQDLHTLELRDSAGNLLLTVSGLRFPPR